MLKKSRRRVGVGRVCVFQLDWQVIRNLMSLQELPELLVECFIVFVSVGVDAKIVSPLFFNCCLLPSLANFCKYRKNRGLGKLGDRLKKSN